MHTIETKLKITGMTCGGCAADVESALRAVRGVDTVDVAHREGRATVTHDANVTVDALRSAVRGAGFEVA